MDADTRLAEIRYRVEAATAGTWGTHYDGSVYHLAADMRVWEPLSGRPIGSIPDGDDRMQAFHDAMFIGRSLDDVRWLLAELTEARTKLAIVERQIADLDRKLAERDEQIAGLLHTEITDDEPAGVPR